MSKITQKNELATEVSLRLRKGGNFFKDIFSLDKYFIFLKIFFQIMLGSRLV
jgi:hypothetical protein